MSVTNPRLRRRMCNSAVTIFPPRKTTPPHNMADASGSHSTAPAHHPDVNNLSDITGKWSDLFALQVCASLTPCSDPLHPHEAAPTFQSPPSTNLPLRQARQSFGGAQPKIHDVTEKFTRACSGKFACVRWRGMAGQSCYVARLTQ